MAHRAKAAMARYRERERKESIKRLLQAMYAFDRTRFVKDENVHLDDFHMRVLFDCWEPDCHLTNRFEQSLGHEIVKRFPPKVLDKTIFGKNVMQLDILIGQKKEGE